jgi:uncharacterized protein (DUF1800 family)
MPSPNSNISSETSPVMSAQSAAWIAAARVVRRAGFGATGPAVDAALRAGIPTYVAGIVAADPATDPGVRATPPPVFATVSPLGKGAGRADKLARNQALRDELQTLTGWWLHRMVAVESPFTEKLTFCWHNHFATSAQKVKRAQLMLNQNTLLRRWGRADFGSLAQAILVDAAMLAWLDGEKNTVKGANENLSREFMELFALGHGDGYTETDVREGARALTGWRINVDGTTSLRPRLHDDTSKSFLGVTGDLDQRGYGEAVLARPVSARFVVTRLWRQFVSDGAPDTATVDRLVAAYGSGRDLAALLRAIFTDPSFGAAQGSIVVSPVEWLVGAARALAVPVTDPKTVTRFAGVLRGLGQLPFYPPNVSGWPSGQAWLSSAAADLRMEAAAALARAGNLHVVSGAAASERIDAAGYLLGIGHFSDQTVRALKPAVGSPERLVAIALNTPEYLVH